MSLLLQTVTKSPWLTEGAHVPLMVGGAVSALAGMRVSEAAVRRHSDEEMNVVGHDDEAAAKPMITCRTVEEERNEVFEGGFVVKQVGGYIGVCPY